MVLTGLQCSHAGVRDFRDILVRHIIEVFHVKNHPLTGRKRKQRFLKLELNFVAIQARHRVQLSGQLTLNIANRKEEASFLALEEIEALVGGNPVDPREKSGIMPKAVDIAAHLNEHLLRDIVSVVMVDYALPDMPIH